MQNNKGYLWKGIMFFGKLDVDSRDSPELMVFDKQNKDLLIIHEWTKNEYCIYKKIGKNPKTIMSKKVRVNRFSDNLPIFDKPVRIIEAENTNIIEDQKQIENISKEKKSFRMIYLSL
jgi:hypothetical protein